MWCNNVYYVKLKKKFKSQICDDKLEYLMLQKPLWLPIWTNTKGMGSIKGGF